MFTLKELVTIIIATIVFTFVVSFGNIFRAGGLTLEYTLVALLISFLILLLNVFAKKIIARYLDASIEHKILQWQRYGIYERSYFSFPIPAGVLLPFVLSILTQGYLLFLTFLQFEVNSLPSRVKKAIGLYRFSDVTESHIGIIAFVGILATLFFGGLAYFIGLPYFTLFARLSIYYAFWNMLPLGQLDGTKIFFGSFIIWTLTAIICLIALAYSFFLV